MANGAGLPDIGYGKAIAAVVGGIVSIILIFVGQSWTGIRLPAEIWGFVQTMITAAAVVFIPHTIGKP
jgi:hypothetical protein